MTESDLVERIESSLMQEYGPILSNETLSKCLGYPSLNVFRKALSRNILPVKVFAIPNRSGKFALTREVAIWLASQRDNSPYKEKSL